MDSNRTKLGHKRLDAVLVHAPKPCATRKAAAATAQSAPGEDSDMSLAIVHSRALDGLSAAPVTVEVHLTNGLPSFTLVGLQLDMLCGGSFSYTR
ncbi:hypothetical protein WG898_03720 [Paucibacter sp. AS307]|uniref:hypothetical protein n=1 Tax=Paucibacter soli TaxID=3133433 RepID=UPI0030B67E6B